jgi:hypothetical protein
VKEVSRGGESVWIEADCCVDGNPFNRLRASGYRLPGLFESRSTQYNWCQMGPSQNREGGGRGERKGGCLQPLKFKGRAES